MNEINLDELIEVQGELAKFILNEGIKPYQMYSTEYDKSLKEDSYLFENDETLKAVLDKWKKRKDRAMF